MNKENKCVLEIGSHDVNGSVRNYFVNTKYTGVDLSPGVGVDIVASGHEVDFPDESFDMTISCECFEHNPHWIETFRNMYRMTKQSGLVVITCASRGRLEHGTARTSPFSSPGTQAVGWNYYRNLNKGDFNKSFNLSEMFEKYLFFYIPVSQDLYFVGWRRNEYSSVETCLNLDGFIRDVKKIRKISNSEGIIEHYFAAAERILLSPLTGLDDVKYQNIMQSYLWVRHKIANIVKPLVKRN